MASRNAEPEDQRKEALAGDMDVDNDKNQDDDSDEEDAVDSTAEANNSEGEDKSGSGNSVNDDQDEDSDDDKSSSDDESANDSDSRGNSSDDDSSSGESEEDNDGDDPSDGQGLSEYEKMRLERIKRNKERLIKLGLESKDGGGVLGRKKSSQSRRRSSGGGGTTVHAPKRRSRRSTDKVDYSEPSLALSSIVRTDSNPATTGTTTEETAKKPKRGRRPKENRTERVPRYIYDEFKSIERHKRLVLKQAVKNMKSADKEFRHWHKKAEAEERRIQKEQETKQMLQQIDAERAIFGTSAREFVQHIEKRVPEILSNVRQYDCRKIHEKNRVDAEVTRIVHENKMKLLDAMDSYPRAMKDAVRTLNSFLNERAPKDPPPPRRSKRKTEEESSEHESRPTKKKKKSGSKAGEKDAPERVASLSDSGEVSTAATQASLAEAESILKSKTSDEIPEKTTDGGRVKKKRDLNVGGWVNPIFAASIDRSWLEKDTVQGHFDLKKFVPQPGDTVLYYPAGHRAYLDRFPDHLASNRITRMPLWERARKESTKMARANAQPKESEGEQAVSSSPPTSKKMWYTDEWIRDVEASLGNYPLICRVEKTQAEFPPDPNAKYQIFQDGQLVWKLPDASSKTKAKKKTFLHLAVTLRPLTTLVPPTWTDSGLVDETSLSLPPSFTAVTFPSQLHPFLVPLTFGYKSSHSLSLNEDVVIPQTKPAQTGQILSFATLDSAFGSFRLEDKLPFLADLLKQTTSEETTKGSSIVDGLKGKTQHASTIPPQELFMLRDFLNKYLKTHEGPNKDESTAGSRTSADLVGVIRSTLPLWDGVSVRRDLYDRRTFLMHPWDLSPKRGRATERNATVEYPKDIMDVGLPRRLDSALRLKMECTIEDFLRENPSTDIFRARVTEDVAPSYSCAVPLGMAFDRVLLRLKERKTASGETACYYRSFDSLVADITSIQENCLLYNSPDSDVVQSASDVIPQAKKNLSGVASRHFRERGEKIKEENEKRKLVMHSCNSAALVTSESSLDASGEKMDKGQTKAIDPFKEPFKGRLYRDWIQTSNPDVSWREDQSHREHNFPQWVPQAGDSVQYSRSLHAEFVKGHYDNLATNQCILPTFKLRSADGNEINDTERTDSNDLSDAVRSGWIVATIGWVRAEFPRYRKDAEETFRTAAPILAIGLQFPEYVATEGNKLFVVYWRPCLFAHDADNSSDLLEGCCQACGVRLQTSFLRPSWANQFGSRVAVGDSNAMPSGLGQDVALAIERNLSLLKRRCIDKKPPDFVDTSLTTDNVKAGHLPQMVKIGMKSLPSFEDLLRVEAESAPSNKTMATRGIRTNNEPDSSLYDLAAINFLPPWLPHSLDTTKAKKDSVSLHESISAWPSLCLELVLIRLKNGFYRQTASIYNDIVESYVTSVILCLAPQAKRKKNPLSIKKIASALSTSKVDPGLKSSKKQKVSKKTKSKNGSPTKPQTQGKSINSEGVVVNGKKKDKPISVQPEVKNGQKTQIGGDSKGKIKKRAALTLNEEEAQTLARLESVRRLYAAALVSVSETTNMGYLFGLTSLQVSVPNLRQRILPFSFQQQQAAQARWVLMRLVDALSREAYSSKRLPRDRPTMKVKFRCGGEIVKYEKTVSIASLSTTKSKVDSSGGTNPSGQTDAATKNGSNIVVVQDGIEFGLNDFEGNKNEELARLFFGKPERMYPCARCQVWKRTMFKCRVIKGHTNVDFGLVQCFRGGGGLDALFRTLHELPILPPVGVKQPGQASVADKEADKPKPGQPPMPNTAAEEAKSGQPSMPNTAGEAAKSGESSVPNKVAEEAKSGESSVPNKAAEEAKAGQVSVPNEAAGEAAKNTSGSQNQEETKTGTVLGKNVGEEAKNDQSSSNANQPSDAPKHAGEDDKTSKVDPRVLFKKAEYAYELAKEVLKTANAYASARARLSDEFIATMFPFDDRDGHYGFCIICGLSGDLLCCDGCANVAHPGCAGLDEIPEGEWFCDQCVAKKMSNMEKKSPSESKGEDEESKIKQGATGNSNPPLSSGDNGKGESPIAIEKDSSQGDKETYSSDLQQRGDTTENSVISPEKSKKSALDSAAKAPETGAIISDQKPIPASKMPPRIVFDEAKADTLNAVLDELFLARTGRRRNTKSEAIEKSAQEASGEAENKPACNTHPNDGSAETTDNITLGTTFQKKFGKLGYFKGTVQKMPTDDHPFYRVIYEDGDEEDLSEKQLLRLLTRKKKIKRNEKANITSTEQSKANDVVEEPKVETNSVVKRKRGRPRKRPLEENQDKSLSHDQGEATQAKEVQVHSPKRGRPRKRPLEENQDKSLSDGQGEATQAKEVQVHSPKRGRPRKRPLEENQDKSLSDGQGEAKKAKEVQVHSPEVPRKDSKKMEETETPQRICTDAATKSTNNETPNTERKRRR